MKNTEKLVDVDKLNKLGDVVKLYLELTVDQKKSAYELDSFYSNYIEKDAKKINYSTNINSLENYSKKESNRENLNECLNFFYSYDNSNIVIASVVKDELSRYVNLDGKDVIDTILSCFSIRNSLFRSKKVKELANKYLIAISNYLASCYVFNKKRIESVEYMEDKFNYILKCIKSKNLIKMDNEKVFYDFLNFYYYFETEDNEKIDVASLIKNRIDEYNNITMESKNPIVGKSKKLSRYIIRNSIEKIDYNKFPKFTDEDFLDVISTTRKYVEKINNKDICEKLAVIDGLHMAYYKKK